MAASGTVRIWWDPDMQAYRLVTPYSDAFKQAFMAFIPGSDRFWDASAKSWTFSEKHLTQVFLLVEKVFGSKPTVITRAQAEKASVPPSVASSPLDSLILKFFRLLPYEAVQKAYRHAAMSLHPDHGGDMEKMSSLNSLWQRIEKEIYGQK
jgi:hypothetical protein